MRDIDLAPIFTFTDPNIATDYLINTLSHVIKNNTIIKKLPKRKSILKPWITPGLLKCMRNRDHMHKKLKQTPDNAVLRVTYLRYRNFCTKILKKVKRQFDSEELRKAGNNSKLIWSTVKRVTNTAKTINTPCGLVSSKAPLTQR